MQFAGEISVKLAESKLSKIQEELDNHVLEYYGLTKS